MVLSVGRTWIYYLVSGTATTENGESIVAACALNTAAPNTEVNVKADAPSLEKNY